MTCDGSAGLVASACVELGTVTVINTSDGSNKQLKVDAVMSFPVCQCLWGLTWTFGGSIVDLASLSTFPAQEYKNCVS